MQIVNYWSEDNQALIFQTYISTKSDIFLVLLQMVQKFDLQCENKHIKVEKKLWRTQA